MSLQGFELFSFKIKILLKYVYPLIGCKLIFIISRESEIIHTDNYINLNLIPEIDGFYVQFLSLFQEALF